MEERSCTCRGANTASCWKLKCLLKASGTLSYEVGVEAEKWKGRGGVQEERERNFSRSHDCTVSLAHLALAWSRAIQQR